MLAVLSRTSAAADGSLFQIPITTVWPRLGPPEWGRGEKKPLAATLLEHDARTDELYALGTLGGEMFNDFFQKFEFKLSMEHPAPRVRVAGTCTVEQLDNYCRQQVRC